MTICPKCRAVRAADTSAPEWQCPSCGVAYAKVGSSEFAASPIRTVFQPRKSQGLPWGKVLMVLAILYGAWSGFQNFKARSGGEVGSIASRVGSN